REVDAGREDDQRLGDSDDADDRHLLKDEREIEGSEEAAADERAEDQGTQDQNDEGDRCRVLMEEMLHHLERRARFLLEGGDGRITARKHALIFRRAALA